MSDRRFSELLILELLLRSPAPFRVSAGYPRDRLLFSSLEEFMTLALLPTFPNLYSRGFVSFLSSLFRI